MVSHLYLALYTSPNDFSPMHFFFKFVSFLNSLPPVFFFLPPSFNIHHLSISVLRKMHSISMHSHHQLPCLHCHPHTYIRIVQHLIERCLVLRMSRDQCIKALAEHAKIRPLVTLTVWRELLKENREFFAAYFHAISPGPCMGRQFHKAPRFARRQYRK